MIPKGANLLTNNGTRKNINQKLKRIQTTKGRKKTCDQPITLGNSEGKVGTGILINRSLALVKK